MQESNNKREDDMSKENESKAQELRDAVAKLKMDKIISKKIRLFERFGDGVLGRPIFECDEETNEPIIEASQISEQMRSDIENAIKLVGT
jgi:hypothetical protein